MGNADSGTHETGNCTVLLNSVADVEKPPSLWQIGCLGVVFIKRKDGADYANTGLIAVEKE